MRAPFTPRSVAAVAWAIGALALGACARDRPAARDAIRFAHGPHLRSDATCAGCHPAAGAAEGEAEGEPELQMMPSEADCRACHRDGEEARCAFCHTVPQAARGYPPRRPELFFDHREHEQASRGQCVRCHGQEADPSSALAFEPSTPSMQSCTSSCHAEQMARLECAMCHRDLSRYSMDELAFVRHTPGFARRHGSEARADGAQCTQCHEPSFCSDCHLATPGLALELREPTRVWRDFVHRGDWLSRHATETRLERGACAQCHGVSYCDGCHRQSGVGGSVAPGSPHPPGWLDPLSTQGHARAARRDMMACASCHLGDAERTCTPCHRAGGIGPNPHPPGFGAGMDPQRHGMCRVCHAL